MAWSSDFYKWPSILRGESISHRINDNKQLQQLLCLCARWSGIVLLSLLLFCQAIVPKKRKEKGGILCTGFITRMEIVLPHTLAHAANWVRRAAPHATAYQDVYGPLFVPFVAMHRTCLLVVLLLFIRLYHVWHWPPKGYISTHVLPTPATAWPGWGGMGMEME